MAQPQKEPLRALSEQEERELKRLAKATSERLDVVRRAKALVAVATGKPFTQAAHEAGLKSGDGVGKLVKRFNAHGLAALSIAAGAGRKPTYTGEQRARIVEEVQREPDRKANQTAPLETKVYQTKFNLGGDPFQITTTDGPMYVVLAHFREINDKALPSNRARAVKIAVAPEEEDYIKDEAHKSEQNKQGFLFKKGDFVQLTGKPGSTREVPVRGYAFSEQPTMLKPQKQKPGR